MKNLLVQIQEELEMVAKDLDAGRIANVKSGLHYLHAFIETEQATLHKDQEELIEA